VGSVNSVAPGLSLSTRACALGAAQLWQLRQCAQPRLGLGSVTISAQDLGHVTTLGLAEQRARLQAEGLVARLGWGSLAGAALASSPRGFFLAAPAQVGAELGGLHTGAVVGAGFTQPGVGRLSSPVGQLSEVILGGAGVRPGEQPQAEVSGSLGG
jgi:hypothetical protein